MKLEGWRACVNALRHNQPPQGRHRARSVQIKIEPSFRDEDMAILREILPLLLNPKLFPTIIGFCYVSVVHEHAETHCAETEKTKAKPTATELRKKWL